MHVTFYGGAGEVTGSKHLFQSGSSRILLDCGTAQGMPDTRERNRNFSFTPETIDQVILSHAHLDHCGMLPLLVKRGFDGAIIATPATRDVARYMLEDAGGIEQQDAEYRHKHRIGAPDDREPLFTVADVEPIMKRFIAVPYARVNQEWHPVMPDVELKFYDAGHILGSAVTVLKVTDEGKERYLAYTGDLGALNMPLLPDPEIPAEPIDTLILESTYGSRHHESLDSVLDKFIILINQAVEQKSKIIVPAFSLGRTQLLVYLLHKLTDEKKIPRLPIFVDSPLATDITSVFMDHRDNYDQETWQDFSKHGEPPFVFRNLTYVRSVEESKKLNFIEGPCMIIASSGMMTAGRVVHHLRQSISNPNTVVLITGYQAQGTVGRQLLEGSTHVELHGDVFPVRAKVAVFNEFSAHADQEQLVEYVQSMPSLKRVMLVHGEMKQAQGLQQSLQEKMPQLKVDRPEVGETIHF